MFMLYLRAIRPGRCRERRYADHIFIQIYFRMHQFVVNFFLNFALGGKGALTPLTKSLRTFLFEVVLEVLCAILMTNNDTCKQQRHAVVVNRSN